jgi:hypothetical protein
VNIHSEGTVQTLYLATFCARVLRQLHLLPLSRVDAAAVDAAAAAAAANAEAARFKGSLRAFIDVLRGANAKKESSKRG